MFDSVFDQRWGFVGVTAELWEVREKVALMSVWLSDDTGSNARIFVCSYPYVPLLLISQKINVLEGTEGSTNGWLGGLNGFMLVVQFFFPETGLTSCS